MRSLARRALAGLATLLAACQTPRDVAAPPAKPDPLTSRHVLEQGRALLREGRDDDAVRVLQRGVADDPGNARLHAALARALEAQGKTAEAAAARARADLLAPPEPALPRDAVPGRGLGMLVAIVPVEAETSGRTPAWPAPELERVLTERLAIRLPEARVLRADPGSVGAARQWLAAQGAQSALSLALERSWCGFTVKDGDLAVAVLRVAAAQPGLDASPQRMTTAFEPRTAGDCEHEAVARALERALAKLPVTPARVAAPAEWTREALRALFPSIARNLHDELRNGRALLGAGELGEAQRAFEAASAIDPGDPEVQALLADTALTLELARELAARSGDAGEAAQLEPRLSEARREAAERALEEERRRRDELLAALAVLDEDLTPPPAATLAALRPAEVDDPEAFGPRLARERARGDVVARVAYAPDGSELARYYLPRAGGGPVLREEDTDQSGEPDRWIAYRGAARSEIFEAASGASPALHFVFADGGEPLLRVEMDARGDGEPERVFRYEAGQLQVEELDTDGDGRRDRVDHFDASGRVALREEDLDGDGAVDVRSLYEQGRLVRREFSDPSFVPES
jgi:tetratricopeptide (TPR) repeat protein